MASGLRIAFSYKARSGKDTCAEYAVSKHGGQIVKFADHLYDLMYKIQDHCGFKREKDSILLQWIGSDYGRAKDENVWVKQTVKKIDKILTEDPFANIFITDARFPNEVESLKKLGFIVCKVNRSIDNRGDIGRDPNHSSEISLDSYNEWDFIIENNGTLEELYAKVDNIINRNYYKKL